MSTSIQSLPDIGEITDIEVTEILVKEGQPVTLGQPLLVIESEKATIEVPSDFSGTVDKLLVSVGDALTEKASLMQILTLDSTQDTIDLAASQTANEPVDQAHEVAADPEPEPVASNSISASHVSWIKAGPAVKLAAEKLGVNLAEVTATGPRDTITQADLEAFVRQQEAAQQPSNQPMQSVAKEPSVEYAEKLPTEKPAVTKTEETKTESVIETAIEPAKTEKHAPIAELPLPEEAASAPEVAVHTIITQPEAQAIKTEPLKKYGSVSKIPLSRLQRTVAKNMSESWRTVPHVTQQLSVDCTNLNKQLSRLKENWGGEGFSITPLSLIIRAVALTLEDYPLFRSLYDEAHDTLLTCDWYDIGVAVDMNPGLVVPVLRDCLASDAVTVAKNLSEVGIKARSKKLLPADMQGGVFTISSLGRTVNGYFTPIIFKPQVAILGVSGIYEKFDASPIRRGAITPHLPLSLSYDHRVVNGVDGANFLASLAERINTLQF